MANPRRTPPCMAAASLQRRHTGGQRLGRGEEEGGVIRQSMESFCGGGAVLCDATEVDMCHAFVETLRTYNTENEP